MFNSIFNELEKYSWNIECVVYIMDLLHIHLKELLDTISQVHIQCITQQLTNAQVQQTQQNLGVNSTNAPSFNSVQNHVVSIQSPNENVANSLNPVINNNQHVVQPNSTPNPTQSISPAFLAPNASTNNSSTNVLSNNHPFIHFSSNLNSAQNHQLIIKLQDLLTALIQVIKIFSLNLIFFDSV